MEPLTDALLDEALPLLVDHWREIVPFKDIPLAPDLAAYRSAFAHGNLICITGRIPCDSFDLADELVGYAFFFVREHLHFKTSLQAVQDALYLSPACRGLDGVRLLRYCERALRERGVQVLHQHVTPQRDFGPILTRMGYVMGDVTYSRRLDC